MCLESQKGSPSYNDLAARFETIYKQDPTKQAISKKINEACTCFFQSVLAFIIKSKMSESELEIIKNGDYKRVLVQDSTIIKLPQRLFKIFAGAKNGTSMVCYARIQGVYDLLSGRFICFSIDPYSKNDQSVAGNLEIFKGDLTLRDRGYYAKAEMIRHLQVGADFVYRYMHNSILYSPKTGEKVDLISLLKKNGKLDMEICLNEDSSLKVRLIATAVGEEVANVRRMKAKKETKGRNPSAELLELMGWTIFITSIPERQAGFEKILLLYRLRWRIEIIFKVWKSHMQFAKLHNVSENQLRVLLTARLIMIVICMQNIYNSCYSRILSRYRRNISLIKLISYLKKNPEKLIDILSMKTEVTNTMSNKIDEALLKYCTYDRRQRLNYNQMLEYAFA